MHVLTFYQSSWNQNSIFAPYSAVSIFIVLFRLDINIGILSIGAIIGLAFLSDVKVYSNQEDFNRDKQKHFSIISKYFDGYKYGFLIRNAKMFRNQLHIQVN